MAPSHQAPLGDGRACCVPEQRERLGCILSVEGVEAMGRLERRLDEARSSPGPDPLSFALKLMEFIDAKSELQTRELKDVYEARNADVTELAHLDTAMHTWKFFGVVRFISIHPRREL